MLTITREDAKTGMKANAKATSTNAVRFGEKVRLNLIHTFELIYFSIQYHCFTGKTGQYIM